MSGAVKKAIVKVVSGAKASGITNSTSDTNWSAERRSCIPGRALRRTRHPARGRNIPSIQARCTIERTHMT